MTKPKLYVGCALSDASGLFVQLVDELKTKLKDSYEILDFVGLDPDASPQHIFKFDSNCVRSCDVFLAICDHTSLGLGVELGIAHSNNVPTLAVAHADTRVSRMVTGMEGGTFSFKKYTSLDEVPELLAAFVTTL